MSKILVIDDEFTIIEILRDILEDEGYQVVTANNGQEGLACLEETHPDMILCDVMMPLIDGFEVCRRVNSNPRYSDIPVVMMTAAQKSLQQQDCHFSALLPKPFEIDEVLKLAAQFTGQLL